MSSLLASGAEVLEGRFRVVKLLGGGGMGEVYLAEQVSLGRKVALKVLKRELGAQPEMHERFQREATLLSQVEHPAVVRVIDFGVSQGTAFLVMEYVEGTPLDQELRHGPLAPARAVPLLQQLADGLGAVHDRGIVHRDLKPENVILVSTPKGEQARLLDFGIARLTELEPEGPALTRSGLVLGTPEYLSPEQAVGGAVDPRSDLYSFGVLAYRVLAGRNPYNGPGPRDYLAQHAAAPPIPLAEANPALAPLVDLCDWVMRCLEKDPAHRPTSAHALADKLAQWRPAPGSAATQAYGTAPARTQTDPAVRLPSLGTSGHDAIRAQNLAVMLTDIQGFTELTSRQTREENARLLEAHDRLLLPIVKAYGGKLVQKRGDALLVVFRSPTDSVLCGMAMQDALWRRNAAAGAGEPLRVRVALHLGEVLVGKETLVGEPVQVVAAVEGEADGGEVVFTEAVRLAMNRAEVQHEPRSQLSLDGHTLALYRCVPALEGPPFGGRDLARGAPSPTAALGLGALRGSVQRLPMEAPARDRRGARARARRGRRRAVRLAHPAREGEAAARSRRARRGARAALREQGARGRGSGAEGGSAPPAQAAWRRAGRARGADPGGARAARPARGARARRGLRAQRALDPAALDALEGRAVSPRGRGRRGRADLGRLGSAPRVGPAPRRQGARPGLRPTPAFLRDPDCGTRATAARRLGELGDGRRPRRARGPRRDPEGGRVPRREELRPGRGEGRPAQARRGEEEVAGGWRARSRSSSRASDRGPARKLPSPRASPSVLSEAGEGRASGRNAGAPRWPELDAQSFSRKKRRIVSYSRWITIGSGTMWVSPESGSSWCGLPARNSAPESLSECMK